MAVFSTQIQPSSLEVVSLLGKRGHLDIPNTRYESGLNDIQSLRPPFESMFDTVKRIKAHDLAEEKERHVALTPLTSHIGQNVSSRGFERHVAPSLASESLKGVIYSSSI